MVVALLLLAVIAAMVLYRRSQVKADPGRHTPAITANPTDGVADGSTVIPITAGSRYADDATGRVSNPSFDPPTTGGGTPGGEGNPSGGGGGIPPGAATRLDHQGYVVGGTRGAGVAPGAPLPEYDTVDPNYAAGPLQSTEYDLNGAPGGGAGGRAQVDYATAVPASRDYEATLQLGELHGPPTPVGGPPGVGGHGEAPARLASVEYDVSGEHTGAASAAAPTEYVLAPGARRADYDYAAASSTTDPEPLPPDNPNVYAMATAPERDYVAMDNV